MDARAAKDAAAKDEKKGELRLRGLTVSNLLIRAQRLQEEVVRYVDFHKFNNIAWDPEKHDRWGQKKWGALTACESDVARLAALRLRVLEASRACDNVMRFDLTFDELCAALEKTATELEATAA